MTGVTHPHPKPDNPASPEVGKTYDIVFHARPDLGTIRVRVLGGDDATEVTPCGKPTVRMLLISGHIPMASPNRLCGPNDIVTIAPFHATWTEVAGGGA